MSYNNSPIVAASIYKRPKQSGPDLVGHWGVVVDVEGHGRYLLHSTPNSGVVATAASNMSKNWEKVGTIPVKSNKTIRSCLRASMGASTKYVSSAVARYVLSGTCVGTAARIAEHLML
eukprot:TRINITY_DN5402_c0_g1_i1.p1 TRINITY_DN5402_c0_g1~~TRINITY_DN5402_c0_g1_i1.p1  ORF type:complete len:118 (-),score=7.95 TRINITY_DN5402_c0_g1_i1:46-399(-)